MAQNGGIHLQRATVDCQALETALECKWNVRVLGGEEASVTVNAQGTRERNVTLHRESARRTIELEASHYKGKWRGA